MPGGEDSCDESTMMNCFTVRKVLIQLDAEIASPQEAVEAKEHLSVCRECQRFVDQEKSFSRILQSKIKKNFALNTLREAALSAFATEKNRVGKQPAGEIRATAARLSAIAILLVAIIFLSGYFFLSHKKSSSNIPIVETLLQEHISTKLKEHPFDLQTSDFSLLEKWFGERVDFAVRVPRLKGTNLVGGHLCVIAGKRAVSLALTKKEIPISMYIMDGHVMDLSSLRQADYSNGKSFYKRNGKGCNLILWEEKGLIYGIVSDMDERDLIAVIAQSS